MHGTMAVRGTVSNNFNVHIVKVRSDKAGSKHDQTKQDPGKIGTQFYQESFYFLQDKSWLVWAI